MPKMRHLAPMLACGLMLATTAVRADDPIPPGTWHCTGSVCVRDGTVNRNPPFASAQAIVHDRKKNKLGGVVRNCNTGVTTTYGIEDIAEDWQIKDADLGWICKGDWPWRR